MLYHKVHRTPLCKFSLNFLGVLVLSAWGVTPGQTQTHQGPVCSDSRSALGPLCRCTVLQGVRRVDCSNLNLASVPGGIPDDTIILNLSGNNINRLKAGAFDNLEILRELFLGQNGLRNDRLHSDAFRNLTNLELLDLRGNRLLLRADNVAPFRPLRKLRHLDVGNNNIATIDSTFLQVFDQLDNLDLGSNSLICDCDLLWFKNWLLNKRSQQHFNVHGAVCFTPQSVRRQTVAMARFCIPVQRCYFCSQASTNAACNLAQQQCSGINLACQNEVRINDGRHQISKSCQPLNACLNNSAQNQNDCNSGTENSVCHYCCQGDKCNGPESAILDGYQFPIEGYARVAITASPTIAPSQPTVTSSCLANVTQGETGRFTWPKTRANRTVTLPCPYGVEAGYAERMCVINPDSGVGSWSKLDTSECPTASMILMQIANVTIRRENALEVSETLNDVTSIPDVLQSVDVTNAVNTFENLASSVDIYNEDSADVLRNVLSMADQLSRVASNRLISSQLNSNSSSRILRSIDDFTHGVRFPSNVFSEDTPSIDVAVVRLNDTIDSGLLFFGSGIPLGNSHPRVSTSFNNSEEALANTPNVTNDDVVTGSLYMPNSLLRSLGNRLSRSQFVMYEEATFFDIVQKARETQSNKHPSVADKGMISPGLRDDNPVVTAALETADCIATPCHPNFYKTIVNSVVISGAIGNLNISNLLEPVTVTFRKKELNATNPRCVFWKEGRNGGWGRWSNRGCSLHVGNKDNDTNVVCKCTHLTNFALLMDVYAGPPVTGKNELALTIISYIGCTLSLIGLVLTLITYTCFGPRSRGKTHDKKFTPEKRAKVLINFVISLILVNTFFIASALSAEHHNSVAAEFCTAVAVCLHFSLLATMAWMAIQAFNLYMALVKIFATYFSFFLLKMAFIGWGIPLVIVGITLGVDISNYGYNGGLCWLNGLSFYIAFLTPVCIVLVFNAFVFAAVTWRLCKLRKSKISQSDRFDVAAQLRATIGITFLLGLTWVLGIFAIGEASLTFSYLFAVFNSLQGFSVFVFQCLMLREMRQRWVMRCCRCCVSDKLDSAGTSSSHTQSKDQRSKVKATTITAATTSYDNPIYSTSMQ